jgi:hypothetical protein
VTVSLLYPVPSSDNVDESTLPEDGPHDLLGLVSAVEILPEDLDGLMFLFTM